ncbi:MAG: hypothetical protein GY787_11525 [Alteromonadales bacterium]|nr:hypothetical protein [Alteromonadales bacterium]
MLDRQGNKAKFVDGTQYNNEAQQIKSLHDKHQTILVEIYHYDWLEGQLEHRLSKTIIQYGVTRNELPSANVLNLLVKGGLIRSSTIKYLKCLEAMRVEQMDEEQLSKRLNNKLLLPEMIIKPC